MPNRFQSYDSSEDVNVIALVKGAERYIFLYDDSSKAETIRTLGRFASDPELSFSLYDAAVLSEKIRQESEKFENFESVRRIGLDISELMDGFDFREDV